MAWFYPEKDMPAAANLCALAGLNLVRDRLSWSDLEKTPGKLPEKTRYDVSADVQAAAGLKILQVNHSVPSWGWSWSYDQRGRFPSDLRDAYNFYRRIAARWRGKVLAIEPWNEADGQSFGGHTGCEMAAMQKASYLGLKAGWPGVIVGQNAFAIHRRSTLDDFHANRAWPYFETYDLHNYEAFDKYAAAFADHRAVSAGRPLWVTETSLPVRWSGDKKFQEPTQPDLRTQAERVAKTYALSIHEGSAAVFYFILGHYIEGQVQFGLVRPDFTPRPGYLALAAVGRLLADAHRLGRLKGADKNFHVYAFRAKPDGLTRIVLVAWCDEKPAVLKLPVEPLAIYDAIGRESAKTAGAIELSSAPLTLVLPDDAAAKLALDPPPAKPSWLEGRPSPIVLQCLLPKKRVELEKSAYRIARGKADQVPIYVYNFGDKPADVRLSRKGPESWKPTLAKSVPRSAGRTGEAAAFAGRAAVGRAHRDAAHQGRLRPGGQGRALDAVPAGVDNLMGAMAAGVALTPCPSPKGRGETFTTRTATTVAEPGPAGRGS